MAAEELLREMAGGRDRRVALELERALNAARCPKDSRFGEALVNSHFKTDHVFQRKLSTISNDAHRTAVKMNQLRQHFMRSSQCLNYEPLILVERSVGQETLQRALYVAQHGEEPDTQDKPRYMKQLRSRCRTPSTLTTIDAFKVKPKQKRNVWESEESEPLVFKSTVRPCSRLTDRERLELSVGWNLHKPKADARSGEEKDPEPLHLELNPNGDPADDESSPFITHLPRGQGRGGQGEREWGEEEMTLTKSSHNVSFAKMPFEKERSFVGQGHHTPGSRDRGGNAGLSSVGSLAESSELFLPGSRDPAVDSGVRSLGSLHRQEPPQDRSKDLRKDAVDGYQGAAGSGPRHQQVSKDASSGPRAPRHRASPPPKRSHSAHSDPPTSPPDSPILPHYMYTFNPRDFAKPGGVLLVTGSLPSRRSTRRRSKKAPKSSRVSSPSGRAPQPAKEAGKDPRYQSFPNPKPPKTNSKRSIRENTTTPVVLA